MKSIILALLTTLLLTSCATVGKMSELREGLTKSEVVIVVGNPDGFQRNGEYEALLYTDLLISGWSVFSGLSWDRTDYSVILKNDRVVEYGPGKLRFIQRSQNESPYILIHQQY